MKNVSFFIRTNLELKLQEFLSTYDSEIGQRSLKLRECEEHLSAESKMLDEWKEKYEAQEIIYNQIVADKEIEEARIREEKLLLLMMNRSARIIQRAYRRILNKRKSKKKGKGKKGGKK